MDNEKIYDLIDADDSLTDEEKRREYFEAAEYFCDENLDWPN